MKNLLLVGAGGALGAMARSLLSSAVLAHASTWRFPLPTFVVNLLGCFLIGVLGAIGERWAIFSLEARLFLITGILGGFTTFSAFGFESFALLRRGEVAVTAAYAVASVLGGLAAVWLGWQCVKMR